MTSSFQGHVILVKHCTSLSGKTDDQTLAAGLTANTNQV